MAHENFSDENLNLYLQYDYLTVEQYTKIMSSVNAVYQSLCQILIYGNTGYNNTPFGSTHIIPLCIEEIHTGNSISIKFSFEKRFFPKVKVDNNSEINVVLPSWSAVLVLTGVILTYGLDNYTKYLDIRLKKMDIQLKQYEIDEKVRDEAKKQAQFLHSMKVSKNPAIADIRSQLYLLKAQTRQSNINSLSINDVVVED